MNRKQRAYIIGGLPGAGKTTAGEILAAITGGTMLESGDMVRQMAAEDGLEDPSSHELGEWSGQQREEVGEAYIEEALVGMILRGEYDFNEPFIYAGLRNRQGLTELRDFFETTFIWIDARPGVRLDRLVNRERDDEDQFSMEDLEERDRIEIEELGQETLLGTDLADYVVENEGSMEELRDELRDIVE